MGKYKYAMLTRVSNLLMSIFRLKNLKLILNAHNTILIPMFSSIKIYTKHNSYMSSNLNKYKRLSVHLCTL